MNRADAYKLLARELESWRLLPQVELTRRVGLAPIRSSSEVAGEELLVGVCARWDNAAQDAVRVDAVAYGPNHLRTERLEESITVQLTPVTK